MDDPWGSPWAEEEQYQQPIKTTESRGASVTTQLPTAKATTLALGEKINSLWGNEEEDDDDGFGEWASVPGKANTAGGVGFDGPDEGWHRNVEDHAELTNHTKPLAPVWNGSASLADPPKLSPSPLPKHAMRQPSPDPWATEFSRNESIQEPPGESSDEELEELDIGGDIAVLHASKSASASPSPSEKSSDSRLQESTPEASVQVVGESTSEAKVKSRGDEKRNSTGDVDRASSRPSSSPSEGSQHGDPHDSPRTSMDDEPKRPQIPRKVSSKIQELVEHFDGLTNPEDDEARVSSRGSSQVREREKGSQEGTDDFSDFADFDEEEPGVEPVAEVNLTLPDSPKSVNQVPSPIAEPSTPKTPSSQQNVTSPIRTPQKFYGPVEVEVDLSLLEQLFPHDNAGPTEEIFIPDTVPYESFSSTEERKMWYRISRYGPMLKHNTGDDDNYVRVTWAKSIMRDETIKIVARWMEEDRLSGQVVLGGGSKTSTLFGWGDAKAPPVSLAAAFAPKENKKATRPLTIQSKAPDVQGPTSPLSPGNLRRHGRVQSTGGMKVKPPPVLDFGWNAVSDKSSVNIQVSFPPKITTNSLASSSAQLASPVRTSTSSLRPIVLSETIKPIESPQRTPLPVGDAEVQTPVASLNQTTQSKASAAHHVDEEDEDEWGDMISSPNVTIIDVPPSMKDVVVSTSSSLPDIDHKAAITHIPDNHTHLSETSDMGASEKFVKIPTTTAAETSTSDVPPSAYGDPWTSANFSSFDSSAAINTAPPSSPVPKPILQKSVNFSAPPSQTLQSPQIPPPPISQPRKAPPSQIFQPIAKAKEDAEQERLVQSIIKGLPDLSYMLRR